MPGFSRRSVLGSALALAVPPVAAAEETLLAIKGYDPVAYFTEARPVRGLPEIEHVWEDRRWRFARAEHRDLFKADPLRWAPQFASYCAMALARGLVVEADPESWLVADGALFLFARPAGPELFQRDFTGNVNKAAAGRPLIPERR